MKTSDTSSSDKNFADKNSPDKKYIDKNTINKNTINKNSIDKNFVNKNSSYKNPSRKSCEQMIQKILSRELEIYGANRHFKHASDFLVYFESLYPPSPGLTRQIQRAVSSMNLARDKDGYYMIHGASVVIGGAVVAAGDVGPTVGGAVVTCGDAVAPAGGAVVTCGDAVAPAGGAVVTCGDAVAPAGGAVVTCGDAVAPAGGAGSTVGDCVGVSKMSSFPAPEAASSSLPSPGIGAPGPSSRSAFPAVLPPGAAGAPSPPSSAASVCPEESPVPCSVDGAVPDTA